MQQTETYKLNLIETSDPFSPNALNENARTLETELARVDADLGGYGANVRLATGTYKGTGTAADPSKPTAIQFERYPEVLFVYGGKYGGLFFKGYTTGFSLTPDLYVRAMTVNWGEDGTLTWYYGNIESAPYQLNAANVTYTYIGLYT